MDRFKLFLDKLVRRIYINLCNLRLREREIFFILKYFVMNVFCLTKENIEFRELFDRT